MILYEHAVDRKNRELKYLAIMHGADPKEFEKEDNPKVRKDNLLFGDPAEYEKMSEEEKKELSDKMKKKFFTWAKVKNNG
ncbi:MAG: hypothetical protein WC346_00185 [Methanogenium sp.]